MDQDTADRAIQIFSALAHPTRLQITILLCQDPMSVREVCRTLNLSQSATSQHLAVLARAGILDVRAVGNLRIHSVRGSRVVMILALVERFCKAHDLKGPSDLDIDENCSVCRNEEEAVET